MDDNFTKGFLGVKNWIKGQFYFDINADAIYISEDPNVRIEYKGASIFLLFNYIAGFIPVIGIVLCFMVLPALFVAICNAFTKKGFNLASIIWIVLFLVLVKYHIWIIGVMNAK